MRTTLRQEGLVDQQTLSNLKISLIGDQGRIRDSFLSMGVQLGVSQIDDSADADSDFTVYLGNAEVSDVKHAYTRVLLLDDGVLLTQDGSAGTGAPSDLQEGGFATIAASLAWQEALRICDVILPVEIPKKYVTVSLRIDPMTMGDIGDIREEMTLEMGDGEVPFSLLERDDGTGHALVRARLEQGNEMVDQLLDSLSFRRAVESSEGPVPSEIEFRLPRVDGPLAGNGIIVGVGGLGSWALDTLIGSFADSSRKGEGVSLSIIDPDLKIESHNLNRQVLYNSGDIGRPKAEVAKERVERSIGDIEVASYNEKIGVSSLLSLHDTEGEGEFDEQGIEWAENSEDFLVGPCLEEDFVDLCKRADFILCGVDNLKARAVLCGISSEIGVPMINAGAQGFHGQFDLFTEGGSCMLCRYGLGVLSQAGPMSCQEDGEVPFGSIVTSTALFGAIEGLAMISILAEGPDSLYRWPSQISWEGRRNSISMEYSHDFGMFSEVFEPQNDHSAHIRNEILGGSQREAPGEGVTSD